jgi:F-type H+-transporting ATPase subunit delta
MLGSSRGSVVVVGDAVAARAGDAAAASLGADLLAVASLLGSDRRLRAALSDTGTAPEARHGLVDALLGSRVGAPAVEVVKIAVDQRWSSARDLVDAVASAAAQAMFTVAEREGRLDAVQDELFKFGRAVAGDAALRMALTDPSLPTDRKTAIVGDLLQGKAQPETIALLQSAAGNPRGRRVEDAVEELVELASVRRQRVAAEVTSAVALDDDQQQRLAAALGRVFGREVELRVVVDPSVLGGISVRVGDEVIDGTTVQRLEQARRRLVG